MQNYSPVLQSFINKIDLFGAPISLTLNGRRHYQTIYGATYTLSALALLLLFIVI
jgi:hypothetical protein